MMNIRDKLYEQMEMLIEYEKKYCLLGSALADISAQIVAIADTIIKYETQLSGCSVQKDRK